MQPLSILETVQKDGREGFWSLIPGFYLYCAILKKITKNPEVLLSLMSLPRVTLACWFWPMLASFAMHVAMLEGQFVSTVGGDS